MTFRADDSGAPTVQRWDAGSLGAFERTPQGGVKIPGLLTRTGVLEYLLPDGTLRREYRSPKEVFSPESLESLAYAPITDLHPEREGVRIPVTPENYRVLSVGNVATDAKRQGDHVGATLLVQDACTVLKIEQGQRRELSCGYGCVLEMTPGVSPEGEIFDAIQTKIRYNHVALGPPGWGRAGSTVALRLDSGDAIQAPDKETGPMKTEIIDGVSYTVGSAEWQAAVIAHRAKLTTDLATAQGRADASERALAQSRAAGPDPKTVQALVSKRVRLITDCKKAARIAKVTFDDAAAESTDEQGLIVQAIKLLDPDFDPAGKSPEYLAGFFSALIGAMMPGDDAVTPAAALDGGATPPGTPPAAGAPAVKTDAKNVFSVRSGTGPADQHADAAPDPDAARRAMVQKSRDGWKQPLNKR